MMNTISAYYSDNYSYYVNLRHVFIIITAIIISGILIHGVSATPITGPAVISSSGTYQLQNDVINNPFNPNWNGINITSSDVNLDGMGHTIDGRGTGSQGPALRGIYIHNPDEQSGISKVIVKNVTVKKCYSGIYIMKGQNGRIENSTIAENKYGIELRGIFSFNNDLTLNTIRDNTESGVHINTGFDANNIYNNYFNNTQNVDFDATSWNFNYWNTTKTAGTSIVGGPYLGGNYWATPSGNGFSQDPLKCSDTNNDGICDSKYDLSKENTRNVDYLPLTKQKQTIEITISGSINAWSLNIGTIEDTNSIHMNVKSSGDWRVKVKDNLDGGKPTGSAGKMVEYDGKNYVSPVRMLTSPVYVKSGTGTYQALSGTETTIQEGTSTTGTDYNIGVRQTISYSDAVLQGSNQYRVVITFIGSLS